MTDVASALKLVRLPLAADLDDQTTQIVQKLQKSGFPAQFDASYNQNFQFSAFGRVVYIPYSAREYDLVLVTTVPWSDVNIKRVNDDFMAIAKSAKAQGQTVRFRIASAAPVPPAIDYVFGHLPRSDFEREALVAGVLSDPKQPTLASWPPSAMPRAMELVRIAFGKRLDLAHPREIPYLETIVLDEFRKGTPRNRPLPKTAYVPNASLLIIGCLFGEYIRFSGKVRAEWKNDGRAPFSLALSVHRPGSGSGPAVVNPIGKAQKLYEQGESESLWAFAHTILEGK